MIIHVTWPVYGSTGIAVAFTASLHTRSAGRYASRQQCLLAPTNTIETL